MNHITRGPAYRPGTFTGLRQSQCTVMIDMVKTSPSDSLWLHQLGLMVRTSANKARRLTSDEVGLAAVELAKDIPGLRRALIEALTAQDQGVADG